MCDLEYRDRRGRPWQVLRQQLREVVSDFGPLEHDLTSSGVVPAGLTGALLARRAQTGNDAARTPNDRLRAAGGRGRDRLDRRLRRDRRRVRLNS